MNQLTCTVTIQRAQRGQQLPLSLHCGSVQRQVGLVVNVSNLLAFPECARGAYDGNVTSPSCLNLLPERKHCEGETLQRDSERRMMSAAAEVQGWNA